MYVNIALILIIYAIEPYLWIKSMSVLPRRFENKIYYIMAGVVYYICTTVKQFIAFSDCAGIWKNVAMAIMSVYVTGFTVFFFKGKLYKKILNVGVFCILLASLEVIIMSLGIYILRIPIYRFMSFDIVNVIGTGISKILLIPMVNIFYWRDKRKFIEVLYKRKEIILLAIVTTLFMTCIAPFLRSTGLSKSKDVFSLFAIIQILLLLNSLYIFFVLRKKDTKLVEAEEEISQLRNIMELTTKLKQLEHDMNTHATVISNLVHDKCYDELEEYVDNTFSDVQVARNICTLPDHVISTIINNLIMKASDKKIQFSRHIMLNEFYIPSRDVCGIVSNMVNNAIEATENLEQEKRYVSLDIFPTEGGYNITCMNPYETKVEYFKTTKKDKEKHGLGLGIIKSLAEKNGGVMEIIPNDNWFEITCFIPVPKQVEMQ